MTHIKFGDSVPSAIVVAKNPKTSSLDEMKLYEGKYFFLEDKQEFQLRFFNPLSETIAVRITMNGEISASKLILKPGQDCTIDRFLDDKKKMLFETYNYNSSSKAAEKAVAKNGLLEIEFFKEQPIITTWTTNTTYYPWQQTRVWNQPYYTGDITLTSGTSITTSAVYGSATSGVFNCSTSNLSSDTMKNISFNDEPNDEPNKVLDIKETGRVEKGDKSDQQFKSVDKNFNYFPFHTIKFELKPVSEHKNIIQTEIRDYCTGCGYRMRKKTWQFCPKCGAKN